MKTFESRMQHVVFTDEPETGSSWNYVNESDALAIAKEADKSVSELRVALESFADFVARHMPSNGYDATMVRTELVAVREYLERMK